MKKLVVLMLVLGIASLVNAAPVYKLGNASGVFGAGNTNVSTVAVGGNYDLYVWASNDLPLVMIPGGPDGEGGFLPDTIAPTSGVDVVQALLQLSDTATQVHFAGSSAALRLDNWTLVAGNPFGTVFNTKSLVPGVNGYATGSVITNVNLGPFALQPIFKATLVVKALGAVVSLQPDLDQLRQSFVGNAAGGNLYFADNNPVQQVTFTPEPATMLILGLGGLLLRRKKA